MWGKLYEISSISYQIRVVEETDLNSLLLVKPDAFIHADRFQQQNRGKAVYFGAFINNCAIGYVLLSLDNKKDVMPYTNQEKCADMIDLLVIEPLRNYGIGTRLSLVSSISLLEISLKGCYTLARIGSRSCLTSKLHSA